MITGHKIISAVESGDILIRPFRKEQAGPNSYDVLLGYVIHRVLPNVPGDNSGDPWLVNDEGYIDTALPSVTEPIESFNYNARLAYLLEPGELYLGHTMEEICSYVYVPNIHGRSTAARHGLQVHLTAGFGDLGWQGQYVLEMVNMTPYPMIVYPGTRVAQISFEEVTGDRRFYSSAYQGQRGIVPAKSIL